MQKSATNGRIARRLSRRRVLQSAGIAAAGTTGLSLLACGKSQKVAGPTNQASKQPRRGGVLNYAGGAWGSFDIQGRGFDPDTITQSGARSYTLWYDRLLSYNLVTY